MAKLTFPKNPTVGQQYTFEGTVYDWDGFKWVSIYSPSTNLVGLFKKDLADPNSQVVIAGQPARDWQKAPEVPFPDVWIPFTDNLRMLAGYGDDIQVGGYTVATQASFTRASTATYIDKSGVLRTAAINEPRFEKEGLLIEGQSTNLSINSNTWLTRTAAVVPADSDGWHPVGASTDATVVGIQLRVGTTTDWSTTLGGQPITLSAFVKGTGNVELETSIYAAFALGGKVTVNLDSGTITSTTSGLKSSIRRISTNEYRITLTATVSTNASTSVGRGLYVNGLAGSVAYARFGQIEALPFASSYIPTNGAAATRAADTCWVSMDNAGLRFGDYTLSCEVNTLGGVESVGSIADTARCIFLFDNNPDSYGHIRNRSNKYYHLEVGSDYVQCSSQVPYQNKITFTAREEGVVGNKARAICVNGVLDKTTSSYTHSPTNRGSVLRIGTSARTAPTSWLNGHIRNFRIWHRALSDQQLRSLQ